MTWPLGHVHPSEPLVAASVRGGRENHSMTSLFKLAGGLAAGTLLLLACASVAFAADPDGVTGTVTVDGSVGTSIGVTAHASTSSSIGPTSTASDVTVSTSSGTKVTSDTCITACASTVTA